MKTNLLVVLTEPLTTFFKLQGIHLLFLTLVSTRLDFVSDKFLVVKKNTHSSE